MIAKWSHITYVLSGLLSVSAATRHGGGPTSEPCTDTVVPPHQTDSCPPPNTITLKETETCTVTETDYLPASTDTRTETVTATVPGTGITITDTITASGRVETVTCTETVTATPSPGQVDHTITVTATIPASTYTDTITTTIPGSGATYTDTVTDTVTASGSATVTVTATAGSVTVDHTETVITTAGAVTVDHTETVTTTAGAVTVDHTETVTTTAGGVTVDHTETVTATAGSVTVDHTETVTTTAGAVTVVVTVDHTETVTATAGAVTVDHTETVTATAGAVTLDRTETVTVTAASVTIDHTETVTANASPSTITETITTTAGAVTFLYTQTVTEVPSGSALGCSTEANPLVSTVFVSATATVQVTMASQTIFETVTETETKIEAATETVTQTETKIESTTVTVTELSPSSSLRPSKLPSLAEALIAAGCSNFLHYIQSNATVWEIFNSPQTQTVFAPSDRFFSYNGSLIASRFRARGDADESTTEAGQATYQSGTDRANMARIRNPPGQVQNTNNRNANLKGSSQKVISDSRDPSVASSASRRDIVARSELFLRQSGNASVDLDSLVRMDSGLGAVNNIINGDIAYDGGLIQVTDGLFTLPKNTTRTSIATGETTFADLADRAGLLDLVDKTPSITVFIPSNAAFDVANISPSTNITELAKTLGGHVVQSTSENDIGYLPNLRSGETLTTTTGSTLQITVSGNDYFVNDALITRANLVLENGVAHVIDKVLTGSKTLPDLCSAASSPAASETPNSGSSGSPARMSTLLFHFISITAIIMFFNDYLL